MSTQDNLNLFQDVSSYPRITPDYIVVTEGYDIIYDVENKASLFIASQKKSAPGKGC